jgi:hypothetical protein
MTCDGRDKSKRKTWIGLIEEQGSIFLVLLTLFLKHSTQLNVKVSHYTTLAPHSLEVTKFS